MNSKCGESERVKLIEKLRSVSEHWFFQGLKYDVSPFVMGLPDDVETEKQKCLERGVDAEVVKSTLVTAWHVAKQRYFVYNGCYTQAQKNTTE